MSLFKSSSFRLVAAAAVLALGACSKTGSAPTDFGVNVTVDATTLDANLRAAITSATLTVVSSGATPGAAPVVRMPADLPKAIKTGTARFQYKPGADVNVGDVLTFTIDVSDGTSSIANAQSSVTLATTAKPVVLTLGKGKGNGASCTGDSECGTGFCTDGVCCNERCDDVCVSCKQAGSKGTCKEYAADSDPEMECAATIPTVDTDAGSSASDASDDAAADDATTADADADASSSDGGSTDASESDAYVINTPDGGFMTTPTSCGGACSGARSCKYPDSTKSCGKAFCNSHRDVVSFACNGKGGCDPTVAMCTDYACDEVTGACRTACAAHSDCLAGEYCDSHKCVPRNANGLVCTTDEECSSGHCATGVCCNTTCNQPGLTCNPGGGAPAGKCVCPGVTCDDGVACQVYYQDADGDGYGNASGSLLAGTAKAGCAGTPPAGTPKFVADNTDCDDGDSNVHPGQTAFFPTKSRNGLGSFDYNCDGKDEKETPEYVGGSCKFCGSPGSCSLSSATCSTANTASSFQCPQEFYIPIRQLSEPISIDIEPLGGLTSRASVTPVPIVPIPNRLECCGCLANDRTGFLAAVNCGASANTFTCQPCAAAGQGPAKSTSAAKTQACR